MSSRAVGVVLLAAAVLAVFAQARAYLLQLELTTQLPLVAAARGPLQTAKVEMEITLFLALSPLLAAAVLAAIPLLLHWVMEETAVLAAVQEQDQVCMAEPEGLETRHLQFPPKEITAVTAQTILLPPQAVAVAVHQRLERVHP